MMQDFLLIYGLDSPLREGLILMADKGGAGMLTVGEFSKICQVSIKTLHHYDRIGLLTPVKVDEVTGYRYYDRQQMDRMLLIGRLKRYGFLLDEIKMLLSESDSQLVFLELCRQREKLKLQKQDMEMTIRELSAHLQNFERTGDVMGYQRNYEITTEKSPEMAVMASRQLMGVQDFGNYYSGLYMRISKEHLTPDGLCGAVYYDTEFHPESTDIELIVGIREKEKADKIIKQHLCAKTTHKGPYSSLSDAYGALAAWMEEHGYAWDGAPFEIYRKNQFDKLPPEDWETDIYFPMKEK